MPTIRCPRCQRECATGSCPSCGIRFDPTLQDTPDGGDDDRSLLEDINGSLGKDRYTIDGLLACGGMGIVLHGRRRRDDMPILVKAPRTIDKQAGDRFAREARALATVDHPYLPALIDIDVSQQNRPVLILEYLPGDTLRSLISGGSIDPLVFETVARCCAEALLHCHSRGVIHRDIKPENIIVAADRCMVIDFGLALVDAGQPRREASLVARITPEGTLLGTPPYTAPEQLHDPHHVDGQADIYALGVSLQECLAQVSTSCDAEWRAHWQQTCAALCHHDPPKRPALTAVIGSCRQQQLAQQHPATPSPVQRHQLIAVIIAGCLAALVMLALVIGDPRPQELSGTIEPDTPSTLSLELDGDGRLRISPIGDTRTRLPGGGPWNDGPLILRGDPGETVIVHIRAADGRWELAID